MPSQLARAEELLNPRELEALRKLPADDKNRLSPQVAAQLFQLYLQGYDTERLALTVPQYGTMGLGLIVRARLEYDWDLEKERYTRSLMTGIRATVERATLEGIQFASDGMAVFHRTVGNKFKEFLKTNDPQVLGEYKNMSFKNYKDLVELLQNLTGQSSGDRTTIAVEAKGPTSIHMTPTVSDSPMTASEANEFLKRLDISKDEE